MLYINFDVSESNIVQIFRADGAWQVSPKYATARVDNQLMCG